MSGCSQTQVERDAHLALDNQQQETMRLLSQPHAEVRDLGQLLPSEDAIQILTSLRDSSSTVAHYLQMQFVDSVNDERPYNYSNYISPAKKWGDTEIAERGRSVLVMRARYRSAGLIPHQRGWTDAG